MFFWFVRMKLGAVCFGFDFRQIARTAAQVNALPCSFLIFFYIDRLSLYLRDRQDAGKFHLHWRD